MRHVRSRSRVRSRVPVKRSRSSYKKPFKRRRLHRRKKSILGRRRVGRMHKRLSPAAGIATVRFRTLTEVKGIWMLDKTNTTAGFKFFDFEPYWLPAPHEQPAQQNKYDAYRFHQLKRVSWKLTNMRMFVEDHMLQGTAQAGVPPQTIPAAQQQYVRPLRNWKMYYEKILSPATAAKPEPSVESLYSAVHVKGPSTKIWSAVDFGKNRKMNFDEIASFEELNAGAPAQQQYTGKYQVTGLNGSATGTTSKTRPLGVWLMPASPYPTDVYAAGWQTAQIYFSADVVSYATFRCWKPKPVYMGVSNRVRRSLVGVDNPTVTDAVDGFMFNRCVNLCSSPNSLDETAMFP